jgi:hypothetical protein
MLAPDGMASEKYLDDVLYDLAVVSLQKFFYQGNESFSSGTAQA